MNKINNKKGQMEIGNFVYIFIAIILGLALIGTIASNVGGTSATYTKTNYTLTVPSTGFENRTWFTTGREIIGTPTVRNGTSGTAAVVTLVAANYTIAEGINPNTGSKGIYYQTLTSPNVYTATKVNITYQYADNGYIDDSGGRSIASLIILLTCLAIGMIAIPSMRDKLFDLIGK